MKFSKKIINLFILTIVSAGLVVNMFSCAFFDDKNDAKTDGGGVKTVSVHVFDADGNKTDFDFSTEKSTLRAVLEENDLIKGDEGDFGLYVKEVNGIRADYDENGAYWCFYKNEEMLMTSVDDTVLSDGDSFDIKYTK